MIMRSLFVFGVASLIACASTVQDLAPARDRQDRAALDKLVAEFSAAAEKQPNDPEAQYRYALARSYAAEVAVEVKDKPTGRGHAEAGIKAAEKAVKLKPNSSEYRRILGTLCGQVIANAGISGIAYGKCALNEVDKAIELDPKAAMNYVSHGVGNYYLPPSFGGGVPVAIKDFEKAISLDPKSAEAYLWLGIALRKEKKNAEAHKALAKAVELNPNRIWAKDQLGKTPAQ